MKKKLVCFILAIAMVLPFVPVSVATPVYAAGSGAQEPVAYKSPDYNTPGDPKSGIASWTDMICTSYTAITATSTDFISSMGVANETTWYVLSGEFNMKEHAGEAISIIGDVNIILKDECNVSLLGCTLYVVGDNKLTFWGGHRDNVSAGSITVSGRYHSAAIGGSDAATKTGSNITINGGIISASGHTFAAGIGGSSSYSTGGSGENIVINEGVVTANGGYQAAAIGGGFGNSCGGSANNIVINGGKVTANGSSWSAGIGGGTSGVGRGNASNIYINGGEVYASGGTQGAGIGGSDYGSASEIHINGGYVVAKGGSGALGIGKGYAGPAATGIYVSSATSLISLGSENPAEFVLHSSDEDISSKLNIRYLEAFVHPHEWISVNNTEDTVYACCSDASFRHVGSSTAAISISAQDQQYTSQPIAAELIGQSAWIGYGLEVSDIYYEGVGGTSYSTTTSAPIIPGTYKATAVVTVGAVGGDVTKTISTQFAITKRTWETPLSVGVKTFNYNGYDDSNPDNRPSNSVGLSDSEIAYYYNTENSSVDGNIWSPEAVNLLPNGTYYLYGVVTESAFVDGCTTSAYAFQIKHEHIYAFVKSSSPEAIIYDCVSSDASCTPGSRQVYVLSISDAEYTGVAYNPSGLDALKKMAPTSEINIKYLNLSGVAIETPIKVGTYKAIVSIDGATYYGTDETVSASATFSITTKTVAKPTTGSAVYTYNGKELTYVQTDSVDKDFYQVQGTTNKRTVAGTQDVVFELKDTDCCVWEDGTTAPAILKDAFTINKKPIEIPEESTDEYYYSGGYQIYGYANSSSTWVYNYASDKEFTVSDYYKINAGTTKVTLTLKDKDNTIWTNGSTDDVKFDFVVQPLEVPVPVADPRSFYAGSNNTYYPFYLIGDNYYCYEGLFYNTTNNTRSTGGTQKVSVTPAENMVWDDGTGRKAKTFNFTVKQPSAYAQIYCLIDMENNNEYSDGYIYGSYLYDNDNPSNVYVSKHYKPYTYLYPSNANIEYYYTLNPNNLDRSSKWTSLQYTNIRFSGAYTTIYIYGVVTANGYDTYVTRPCPIYIYRPVFHVASAKTETYTAYESRTRRIGKSVTTKTEAVTKTRYVTTKERSFGMLYPAGKSMIDDLRSGKFSAVQWSNITDNKAAKFTSKSDIPKINDAFCDSGYRSASLLTTKSTFVTRTKMYASLNLVMTSRMFAEASIPSLPVSQSVVNNPVLILTEDNVEKYISAGSRLQDYMLFGDHIGYNISGGAVVTKASIDYTQARLAKLYADLVSDGAILTASTCAVRFDKMYTDEQELTSTNTIYEMQYVSAGGFLTKPADPKPMEGERFVGWYYIPYDETRSSSTAVTLASAGALWNFEIYSVVDDITLYAMYEKLPITEYYNVSSGTADNGSVTTSETRVTDGTKITITVTPEEGYKLSTISALLLDQRSLDITKISDTQYSFLMLGGDTTVSAIFVKDDAQTKAAVTTLFNDLDAKGWYIDAIQYCVDKGIMGGYGEMKFAPLDSLTRGMVVQILYNIEGRPAVAEKSSYTDVEADVWYADAIAWAEDNKIIGGYGNGLFGPVDNITREQLAKVLLNYAAYKKYDVTGSADLTEFADAVLASDWAVEALKWAKAVKLMSGKGEGVLDPIGKANRAEAAKMLMNFCENIAK